MGKQMKVLLVDDEKEFAKTLAERLKLRDLGSDAVHDGEGALDYVEKEEPDVIILDLKMPGISGMEVLKKVKKAYPNIEVIMLTGQGTEKDEEEARKHGVFDYMQKPVNIDKLVKRMREAFRKKTKDMKVLLVDDEEEFVKTLSERLEMRDVSSDAVHDGEGALDYVEKEEPDVMVLDLKMPGIDGMEVLKKVKEKYPDIEVIMLTGHGSERDEEEARKHGALDYMQKPVNIDKLVKRMKDGFIRKFDKYMMAETFAEAGEAEEAKKILDEK